MLVLGVYTPWIKHFNPKRVQAVGDSIVVVGVRKIFIAWPFVWFENRTI